MTVPAHPHVDARLAI